MADNWYDDSDEFDEFDEFESSNTTESRKFEDKEKPIQEVNGALGLVALLIIACNPITLGLIVIAILKNIPSEWTPLAIILTPIVLAIIAGIGGLLTSLIKTDAADSKAKKNQPKKKKRL